MSTGKQNCSVGHLSRLLLLLLPGPAEAPDKFLRVPQRRRSWRGRRRRPRVLLLLLARVAGVDDVEEDAAAAHPRGFPEGKCGTLKASGFLMYLRYDREAYFSALFSFDSSASDSSSSSSSSSLSVWSGEPWPGRTPSEYLSTAMIWLFFHRLRKKK